MAFPTDLQISTALWIRALWSPIKGTYPSGQCKGSYKAPLFHVTTQHSSPKSIVWRHKKWLPLRLLTLSLPNVVIDKFRLDFQISFSNILKNKKYHVKVQAGTFHLNGHIVGFRPQTQKLQSPFKTPSNILAVKGLILSTKCSLRIQLPNIVGLLITTHHWIQFTTHLNDEES